MTWERPRRLLDSGPDSKLEVSVCCQGDAPFAVVDERNVRGAETHDGVDCGFVLIEPVLDEVAFDDLAAATGKMTGPITLDQIPANVGRVGRDRLDDEAVAIPIDHLRNH